MSNNWFRKTTEEIVNTLGTTIEHGLAADIAAKRLLELGPNQLAEGEKQSSLLLLLEQFSTCEIITAIGCIWRKRLC